MTHAPTAPSPTKRWLRALELTGGLDAPGAPTFPDLIDAGAARFADRPALLSDAESLSYAGLAARSNRYSRWALSLGLPHGSTVALLLPNGPDYLAAWIGITRAGLAAALLNTGLVGASLAHCVAVAAPGHALVHASLWGSWAGALPHLAAPPPAAVRGEAGFDGAFDGLSGDPLDAGERPRLDPASRALLIYTSGTTGLPKAAVVSHRRIMTWSLWFAGLAGIGPDDRMYDALPLFHSVGGVVAPGCMLAVGGSVVIAPRFSASAFWPDVARWGCTLFQYIGELCRTLLAAAPKDGAVPPHRLRLALGNGLRPDVWEPFRDRFAIPAILEFYAATEGSFSLSNVEGRVGSIGRVPPFLAHRFPVAVLRFDVEGNAPVRGADGFCVRAAPDEAGEAVGLIGGAEGERREGAGRFEGYTDGAAGDAKVLRDVFARGDRWFRTGDLMRRDRQGFFFFVDRIGDTFRWCGENVATTEVAEAVGGAPGIVEATVYGVAVPHRDGRAGMAALVVGEGFSPATLAGHVAARLPAYARPVFLRLQGAIGSTDTFKHRKAPLVREGFDPRSIADPLHVWDREAGAYRPLDAALFARIEAGAFRL